MNSHRQDERGGFLGKSFILIIIFFVVFGIALVDGSSILFARLQLGDLADVAATDAAARCRDTGGDAKAAYEAALETIADRDPGAQLENSSFVCDRRTLAVTMTVTKKANTFVIQYIGPLKKFADLRATAHQEPPTV